MGEANRRKRELALWLELLSPDERKIVKVARALVDRFIRPLRSTGMCYRMTAFLTERLAVDGVTVEPVIGYINDGTDEVMISHAWIEFAGKRTDVTLGITEHPEEQLAGEVIVVDRVVAQGQQYSYHRQMTEAGRLALELMRAKPEVRAVLEAKEVEHATMSAMMQTSQRRRDFLDAAPDGWTYDRIANVIGA